MSVNYLLLVASLVNERATPENIFYYKGAECDKVFSGVQTNIAPAEYVHSILEREGESLEKIIILCSKEVLEKPLPNFDEETSLQIFKRAVSSFSENSSRPLTEDDFVIIPHDVSGKSSVKQIYDKLNDVLFANPEREKKLFIDLTGGARTATLALLFAARVFQNAGASVGGVYYGNITGNAGSLEKPATIEACTEIYDTFLLLEGQTDPRRAKKSMAAYSAKYLSAHSVNALKEAEKHVEQQKTTIVTIEAHIDTSPIESSFEKAAVGPVVNRAK